MRDTESRIGATPDLGASWYLLRMLGERRALELLLLSDGFDADRAQAHDNTLAERLDAERCEIAMAASRMGFAERVRAFGERRAPGFDALGISESTGEGS